MKSSGDPDPVPVPDQLWRRYRGGLRLAHEVMAAMINGDRPAEEAALAAVASAEVFAPFGPQAPAEERGRWLVDRVVQGVDQARDLVPQTVPGALGHAAAQAVVLWSLHVSSGVKLGELGRAQEGLIEPPLRGRDVRQKIEGRMWLTARPTGRASAGVALLFREVQAALRSGAPAAGGGHADHTARAFFGYEWRRLERTGAQAEQALLTLLSVLAAHPVPVSLFEEAWGPLPEPLRGQASTQVRLGLAVRQLVDRGLIETAAGPAIRLPGAIQPLPAAGLTPVELRRWIGVAVRFLRSALPADTHFHAAWPDWDKAEPHVVHVAATAQQHGVRSADVADLLDRLSVFYRSRSSEDPRAVATAQRAVRLYEELGAPSREDHATYLGNLALAYRAREELAPAVEIMERSVGIVRESLGADHLEYAESLNLLADMLGAARRLTEADRVFEEALAVVRQVAAGTDPEAAADVRREILNDYASHLLRREPPRGRGAAAARRALAMLDEAAAVGDPDGYGIGQVMLNRADALRQLGQLDQARATLDALVRRCEEDLPGEPSLLLFGAVLELAEVMEELGDPAHVEMRRRAHEIDDALQP